MRVFVRIHAHYWCSTCYQPSDLLAGGSVSAGIASWLMVQGLHTTLPTPETLRQFLPFSFSKLSLTKRSFACANVEIWNLWANENFLPLKKEFSKKKKKKKSPQMMCFFCFRQFVVGEPQKCHWGNCSKKWNSMRKMMLHWSPSVGFARRTPDLNSGPRE